MDNESFLTPTFCDMANMKTPNQSVWSAPSVVIWIYTMHWALCSKTEIQAEEKSMKYLEILGFACYERTWFACSQTIC